MTPVKRFEALRSTYMYATKQYLIFTNNSFHRTQTLLFHCSMVYTVEPWYNNGSRDWQNAFAFTRLLDIKLFYIFYFFLYGVHYISRLLRSLCLVYIIFICACHVHTPHVNFAVSLLFRCGFASETSPRHIIRSVLTHTINGQVS